MDDIEEEMEDCDYLVCSAAAGMEAGNSVGECFKCQTPIILPPDMPAKPKKICMKCAIYMMTLDAK